MDWLVGRDEFLQVADIDRTRELASAAYNAISVSSTDYLGSGIQAVDTDYPEGRSAPHVVVPIKYRSQYGKPLDPACGWKGLQARSYPGLRYKRLRQGFCPGLAH